MIATPGRSGALTIGQVAGDSGPLTALGHPYARLSEAVVLES